MDKQTVQTESPLKPEQQGSQTTPTNKPKINLVIIILGIILLLITLCLVTFIILLNRNPKQELILYSPDGSMEYKFPGKGSYAPIKENVIKIDSHALLRTGGSLGSVFLPDESIIVVEPESELRIDTDSTGTYIHQIKGASFHDVEKQNSKAYKIFTPYSTNVVEGTDMLIYVWDPASGSYILQAPGEASAWNSGSGTSVNQGRVGFRADITTGSNSDLDEDNVPDGPLETVVGSIVEIINGGRSPYDIVPGAVDTGAGWSHLDAGNNAAVNGANGSTTSGSNTAGQTGNATTRREFINSLRQLERDYRAGRVSQAEYFNRLRQLLNSAGAAATVGSLDPNNLNSNANLDDWDCAYYVANVKPALRRILDRVYNDASGAYLNLSFIIPRGVEYYDNFNQHVCDDGQLSSSEKDYIREVLQAVGGN